jgi:RimJ/RimL family protein N-acetyltransferase
VTAQAEPALPLSTPSLRLRRFVLADAPRLMALNGEPSTRRWLASHVYADRAAAEAALRFLVAAYAAPGDPRRGPYVLAVDDGASGELIGHVGFSPLDGEVEVSFALAESVRGRGRGVEAVRHGCDWIARAFGLQIIVAVTAAANDASRRTLERAGFAHEGDGPMRFQGEETAVGRYRWRRAPPT